MNTVFFSDAQDFRAWLAAHHADTPELWVGYYKKESGKVGITYPESLDEALCYGWIDGIRRSVDAQSYANRFTPRKSGSPWSQSNIQRVEELTALGRMQPAGLAAFAARRVKAPGEPAYEDRSPNLPEPYAGLLKQNAAAWNFYQAQPPSYRKAVNFWVISAKKEETRLKRLGELAKCCAHGRLIPLMENLRKK